MWRVQSVSSVDLPTRFDVACQFRSSATKPSRRANVSRETLTNPSARVRSASTASIQLAAGGARRPLAPDVGQKNGQRGPRDAVDSPRLPDGAGAQVGEFLPRLVGKT